MPAHRRFPRIPGALITRRVAVGALCVATASAAAIGVSISPSTPAPANATLSASSIAAARTDAATRSNRDLQRTAPPATSKPGAVSTTQPAKPKPQGPGPLPRISGYSSAQVANAWAIVLEGHRMGISPRGQQIAIATAMQESNLYNLRRAVDHDSLGLFQQRPSSGWGSPRQLTNPTYAAHAFYRVLVHYKGAWGNLTRAAQAVQRSAFPNAYAKHTSAALRIVRVLDQRF